MERQPVDSSLIRSVGYDLINSILEIEFVQPNRIYEFFDVPYSVYSWLDGGRIQGFVLQRGYQGPLRLSGAECPTARSLRWHRRRPAGDQSRDEAARYARRQLRGYP